MDFFLLAIFSNRLCLNGDPVKTSARSAFLFLRLTILHFGSGETYLSTLINLPLVVADELATSAGVSPVADPVVAVADELVE